MSRDIIIKYRVTIDEKAATEAAAKAHGMTISDMIRAALSQFVAVAK